jgi:hypothetical protein
MKVHELISILEDCDPEAEVLLSTQPHYPMEYAVAGIAVREEVLGDHGDEDEAEADAPESKDAPEGEGPYSEDLGQGTRRNDVLLLEGHHLRYGDRDAWNNPRTE